MSTAAQRVASAWLRKAISQKHVDNLIRKVDTNDLPFDHLFEGKRRMIVDPEEHGGLGKTEPSSASDIRQFLFNTGVVKSTDKIDWKKGLITDADGKVKSRLGKAVGKGMRKAMGKDAPLFRVMATVEQERGKGTADTPIGRASKDYNFRGLIGIGKFIDPEFPADRAWKEMDMFGFPSPETWKEIKRVGDKFLKMSLEERKSLRDRHEVDYEEKKKKKKEGPRPRGFPEQSAMSMKDRDMYWAARSLYISHLPVRIDADAREPDQTMKDADRHLKSWTDQTDDLYEGPEGEPLRKVFELAKGVPDDRLKELKKLSDVEQKKEEYALWKSMYGEDLTIVLSRDPVDVLRMSDHPKAVQAIESCHSEGGSEFSCAVEEAEEGGLVAYVVKKSDVEGKDLDENELFEDHDRGVKGIKPYSRLRLRRFETDSPSGGLEIAIPETTSYGASFDNLVGAMTEWAREAQPELLSGDGGYSKKPSDWRLTGGAYQDNPSSELFNNFFDREEDEQWGREPSEDEYDPYGEGYTPEDSPYYDPDHEEDEDGGEAEVMQRTVEPWRYTDRMTDFWTWMEENHPKIPNPNRRGRQREITPSTLKGYARGRAGYSAAARELVGRYLTHYQEQRQEYAEARARGEVRASSWACSNLHRKADVGEDFWTWMQQRHPRVPNPNPEGREKDIAPRTLKQYAEGGEFAQRAQQIIRRYQQQFVKTRGQQKQRPAHDKYSHVELKIRDKAPGERERIGRLLGATTDQEIRQRALDLSGMGYLSDKVNEVTIVSRKEGRVEVTGYGDHSLFFNRELDFNEDGSKQGIFNVIFSVAEDAPEGLGTRMIAGQVAAAHQAGFPRIDTHAEGESGTNFNGYYTWPRLGFNTEAKPVLDKMPPELLRKAQELAEQDGAESLQMRHIMMLPEGRDWWKKEGSSISVGMPTNPDSPERKILNEYVEERAKRAGSASAQEWLLKRASRQQRFPLSELENEALDVVWARELERVRGKRKTAKYNSEFMQWAEQQRFIQPETRNRVKFVSLPEEEQKRIYERWHQMMHGEDAERVQQANRWLSPNQDPKRYEHIKFEVRLDAETAEEDAKRLAEMFRTEDQKKIRDTMLDLAGLGGVAKLVESVDVLTWKEDYDAKVKIMGRGKHGLHFDRTLHYDETGDEDQPYMPGYIENNLFSVGRDAPAGIGTRMLASQVGAAENAGFRAIEAEASRGGDMNGYYTWPRLGFNAPFSKEDLKELEEDNPEAAWQVQQLAEMDEDRMFEESPAEMFHVMAIPEAREWWEKNGHGFTASFPLSEDFDGGKAYQLLRAYTEAKAMAEGKTIPEYLAKIAGKSSQNMAPELTEQDQKILDRVWDQARQRIQKNVEKKKASELAGFWLRMQIVKSSLGI